MCWPPLVLTVGEVMVGLPRLLSWSPAVQNRNGEVSLIIICPKPKWTSVLRQDDSSLPRYRHFPDLSLAGWFWLSSRTPNPKMITPLESLWSVDENRLFERAKWSSHDRENWFLVKAIFLGIYRKLSIFYRNSRSANTLKTLFCATIFAGASFRHKLIKNPFNNQW
jgi:hypothetical protein